MKDNEILSKVHITPIVIGGSGTFYNDLMIWRNLTSRKRNLINTTPRKLRYWEQPILFVVFYRLC